MQASLSGDTTTSSLKMTLSRKKRDFIFPDGTISSSSQPPTQLLVDGNFFNGLTSFGLQPITQQKDENVEIEREPAEGEVMRVMNVCNGCVEDPFEKALIMSWRNVPKKLYSGARHVPAVPVCKAF